ncbi:MAG: N-acetylmuramoyl-L-alanine amidase [Moorea sp. SIO1G6]|uniref:N-acetylmuramoyl-L-alanine amidase n=1 Tax=Moorena sp. SIO1G6 TaxID=2607840 RepID=UPI0013BFF4E4|nr:N-acetylmuramoyl-L-alanine amidase [Moorena sp. SIO1G6]NET67283.1 N-acetylmuramoyl-L-alanine amidase [Moorena sp. SIO1G6]
MRFRWLLLLSSSLTFSLFSLAAQARELLFWQYDRNQNRLEFTTDVGVQPTAQLISNPTRLVIDLPGINVGGPSTNQRLSGAIREVRVGQFERQTTRIVVELAPGYTIDPQQVKFRGISPNQWTVQLPQPYRGSLPVLPNPAPPSLPPAQPPTRTQSPPPRPTIPRSNPTIPRSNPGIRRQGFQINRNGFFVSTDGGKPIIQIERSRNNRRINIDLEGVTIAESLLGEDLEVNRYGVSKIEFEKKKESPPIVRMTLNVDSDSPDWLASFSQRLGGVLIFPRGIPAQRLDNGPTSKVPTKPIQSRGSANTGKLATIGSVELASNQTQLLIKANQRVRATSKWDPRSKAYQITIPNAKLAEKFSGPQLNTTSPVSEVMVRQEDKNTVLILVQPSNGTRIGSLNQLNDQLLALQLRPFLSRRPTRIPPRSIPVPPPNSIPVPPPNRTRPPIPRRQVPKERLVVVIDAGHGGKDPGAIGIGGIQEKDVNLSISRQVEALLEKQGIQVVMTRSDDRFISLNGRVQVAERTDADLFVSIHANAIGRNRPDVNGLETYYYSTGQSLAQTIHYTILRSVDISDRRTRRARFYVLRKTSMPAVLVEVGFLTGYEDSAKLKTSAYRSQMARAIARGILLYIRQNRLYSAESVDLS